MHACKVIPAVGDFSPNTGREIYMKGQGTSVNNRIMSGTTASNADTMTPSTTLFASSDLGGAGVGVGAAKDPLLKKHSQEEKVQLK